MVRSALFVYQRSLTVVDMGYERMLWSYGEDTVMAHAKMLIWYILLLSASIYAVIFPPVRTFIIPRHTNDPVVSRKKEDSDDLDVPIGDGDSPKGPTPGAVLRDEFTQRRAQQCDQCIHTDREPTLFRSPDVAQDTA